MNRCCCLVLVIIGRIVSAAPAIDARASDISFEHLTSSQGMLGNEVHCILQDSRGFMWFGTEKGLNRYDGHTFKTYAHDPGTITSICDAKVQSLCEDAQGTIWAGTWQGLERVDRALETFTHFLPDPQAPPGSWRNVIYDLHVDHAGNLWAGGSAVKLFDPGTGTFRFYNHLKGDSTTLIHENVNAIFEDKSGTLWIGTGAGLEHFEPKTGTFKHYWTDEHPDNPDFSGFHWIQKIYEDRRGTLWLCTNKGPVAFDRTTGKFKPYAIRRELGDSSSAQSVSSIVEDDEGTLWIGTWGAGLMSYDAEADSFVTYRISLALLPTNSIATLYKDNSGVIWIGTNGDGVLMMTKVERRFVPLVHNSAEQWEGERPPAVTASLQNNNVRYIYENPDGTILIGTGTGEDHYNPRKRAFKHFAIWDWPYSITGVLNSRFFPVKWTGIQGDGLNKVQENPYRRRLFSTADAGLGGSACSFFEDRSGIIWMLVSDAGVCQFDPRTEKFKNLGIGRSQPFVAARMFVEDSLDNAPDGWVLWIGTQDGLWKYDARLDAFTRFGYDLNDPKSIASNSITTLFRDKWGTLWIGTERGLCRMNSSGTFERMSTKDGLPDTLVLGVVEDRDRRLWVSTPRSISRLDPSTRRFTAYSIISVLPDLRFGAGCCLASSTGELYFGGNGGIVVFNPDSVRDNATEPPVVITAFKTFDMPVQLDTSLSEKKIIEISYSDNVFSFDFAAMNFLHPERNQYAYFLEGHDKGWEYCGSRQYARYINVAPGHYLFRVKASNNDGVWNEAGTSLAVIITPPWWKATWVTVALLVLIAGSVAGTVRYVERRKLKEKIEQLERERVIEKERTRISQDMHDEVGASLSEIAILSELARKKPEESDIHVQEISSRAAEVIDSVSEIVWAMNPKNDSLEGLVAHIRRYAGKYLGLARITCSFDISEDLPESLLAPEIRRSVFLVVKEALHNVVKHSKAAEVKISVRADSALEIKIADNGVGFASNESRGAGNGLENMNRRMQDIGGSYHLAAESGHGVTISLTLPLPDLKRIRNS